MNNGKLSTIYVLTDQCDGDPISAFADRDQADKEAEESGCYVNTVPMFWPKCTCPEPNLVFVPVKSSVFETANGAEYSQSDGTDDMCIGEDGKLTIAPGKRSGKVKTGKL